MSEPDPAGEITFTGRYPSVHPAGAPAGPVDVYPLGDHLIVRADDGRHPDVWFEIRIPLARLRRILLASPFDPPFEEVTDAFVEGRLALYQDDLVRATLHGLYRCRRAMGDAPVDAWLKTLKAHLGEPDAAVTATPGAVDPLSADPG